jgi:hypothetical protein
MAKIVSPDDIGVDNFIKFLKDNEITVYEDVQGSKIWAKWNGSNWEIRPKSVNSEPLNIVDMTTQKFYNMAYYYLATQSEYVTNLLNKDWQFGFEYFSDEQPAHIKYSRLPKNNLLLTCIYKGEKNYSYDIDELRVYADLFDIEATPVIYRGKLSDKQINLVNTYLNTSERDLKYVFDEDNFAKFFYELLNPQLKHSFLMGDDDFQDNLEKIIIRPNTGDEEMSVHIFNPFYNRVASDADTDYMEIYSIILMDFLTFMQDTDINTVDLTGTTRDSLYIELCCKLYNMYMQNNADRLLHFGFVVPRFFSKDKFRINKDMINNPVTLDWIEKNPKFEYVFKILLISLQKEKKKTFGLFTPRTIEVFNLLITAINDRIKVQINRNIELNVYKDKLLSYAEYVDSSTNFDGEGRPYFNDYGKNKNPLSTKKVKSGFKK